MWSQPPETRSTEAPASSAAACPSRGGGMPFNSAMAFKITTYIINKVGFNVSQVKGGNESQ